MTISIDSAMDGYYSQDRLQEIWQQIGALHFSYLELEESPQKLEQRNKLEDYIREFLCLAPHNQKFFFHETADILHRSASTKKDFSGYRAALGWNAIGMYAANLLNQPWRKEYRQIQLYSGFYKHQIDANLVGAEVIFEAMGYKHDGDGILTLDGPICPDRVISISQDSLIAYVECQILKAIWEEVSANFKITWLEVLEFRETHLCSPKQSVQALNYRFHERQFQQHTRSYSQVPPPPPPYVCPTIPTGQLIEVDSQSSSHQYDTVDGPSHSRASKSRGSDVYNIKNDLKNNSDKEESHADTISSWDYVYRNLESQGYSKDLGERGDVLSPPLDSRKSKANVREAKKVKSNILEDSINSLSLNDKMSRTNETHLKYKERERERHNSDASKSYEHEKHADVESAAKKQSIRQSVNGFTKGNNTLPVQDRGPSTTINNKADYLLNNRPSNSKTLDLKKMRQNQENDRPKPKDKEQNTKEVLNNNPNKWHCNTCTFLNDLSREICEMCGKSKVKVQDIMEIGGPQCPRCTLVNPKDNKVCEACSGSLKDSPTYI